MVFPLLAMIAISVGGFTNGVFQQGQANPEADGFLDSKSKYFERL